MKTKTRVVAKLTFITFGLLLCTVAFAQKLEMVVQTGVGPITALALSPDEQFLLTGQMTGSEAVLWEVATGREIRRFRGHEGGVRAVAFSPDGRRVLTGSEDGTARFWEMATGRETFRFGTPLRTSADAIVSVEFSENGKVAMTGSYGGRIHWINTQTGRELSSFEIEELFPGVVHKYSVIKGDPYGRFIVAGGYNYPRMGIFWRREDRFESRTAWSGSHVQTAAISPDGNYILTGHQAGIARLWDANTGKVVRDFLGHDVVSPRSRYLYGKLESPETDSLTLMGNVNVRLDGVLSVCFSADGRLALTGGADGTARLWDVATGRQIKQLDGHNRFVLCGVLSQNAQRAFTAGLDGTARIWDLETGEEIRRFEGYADVIVFPVFSADNQFLLTGGLAAALWALGSGQVQRVDTGVDNPMSEHVKANAVSFHQNTALYALLRRDGSVGIWDVKSGKQIGSTNPVDSVGIWDVKSGKRIFGTTPIDRFRIIHNFAISHDHRFIAIGTSDGTLILETDTGKDTKWLGSPVLGSDLEDAVTDVAFSADSRHLLTAHGFRGRVTLWDIETGLEIRHFEHEHQIATIILSADDRLLLVVTGKGVRIWEVKSGRVLQEVNREWVSTIAISPDNRYVLTGSMADNTARLYEVETGRIVQEFAGHRSVGGLAFSPDGRLVATADIALGPVRLWEVETGHELARLISFKGGNWAVIDPEGRFDASNGGEIEGLHWVVGLETIALNQLKERYYEPGLLAKILGFNDEPLRDVKAFIDPKLYPEVRLDQPQPNDSQLRIHLSNRGGGIGRVSVFMNGKEIRADARDPSANPDLQEMELQIDIADHPFLKPGEDNLIEVKVFNAEGYLSSRNVSVIYKAPEPKKIEPPTLWSLIVGVSEYRGDQIDLRFAAKDAVDMAFALKIGAKRLFGVERVQVSLLTTEHDETAIYPSKENVQKAFKEIAKQAKSTDILVVYLAGHGVNYGGQDGDYYYLTAEARTGDLKDPVVRESAALSSAELTELIKMVPALKQVLILDTCASGRLIQSLTEARNTPSSQIRALERLKDRTGMHILAGSAADAVSYEASRYGQGLLTYSLLLGMRGAALREEEFIDISKLFEFSADQVPQLAKDIGGIQRPIVATPRGGASFDIGQLKSEDKPQIPLAIERPLVLRTNFQHEDLFADRLGLGNIINQAMREISARGRGAKLIFVDTPEFPGAYSLAGRYGTKDGRLQVVVRLFRGEETVAEFRVVGDSTELDKLAADILQQTEIKFAVK